MSLNINKGEVEALSSMFTKVSVRAGWDVATGVDMDLDLSVIIKNGPVVFFNNKEAAGIKHNGDNLTGAGAGDDETIDIDLTAVSSDELIIVANIFKAGERRQDISSLNNAFIRLVDKTTGEEVMRTNFVKTLSTDTAVAFGKLTKTNGSWKFTSLLENYKDDLNGLAARFGTRL